MSHRRQNCSAQSPRSAFECGRVYRVDAADTPNRRIGSVLDGDRGVSAVRVHPCGGSERPPICYDAGANNYELLFGENQDNESNPLS